MTLGSTLAAAPPSGLDQVVAVAAGGTHALALRADGTVWGWGTNSDWELGVTTPSGPAGSATPVQATGLAQVQRIATGDDHGLALGTDGHVWAWGKNDHSQVGVPQGKNCPYHPRPCVQTPVPVPGLSGIKAVAAAQDSSFALGRDGVVWAWGDNARGQLGTGAPGDTVTPAQVSGLDQVVAISAASMRTIALRADGTVWAWGDGTATPAPVRGLAGMVAVAAGAVRHLAQTANGTVWAWGELGQPVPAPVAGLGPMVAIAGGGLLSGAVAADGGVWTWGLDPLALQPASPTRVNGLDQVIAVAMGTGGDRYVALKGDGTVWTWDTLGAPRPVPAPTAAATPTAAA
jgi:alpha-tubulin suppressor-like RCC1 family protein